MEDQRRRVMDAYDDLAEVYAAERSDDPPAILDRFVDRLAPDARVLDAGCGQGTPVASALSTGFDVVGLDASREQLRLAGENAPDASLARGDMTALGFRDDAFDGLCALHSVIHVPVEEHPTVFAEFARVLRPGAPCLVSGGPEAWAGRNPDWLDSGVEMLWSYPGADETASMLEDAGFGLIESASVADTYAEDAEKPFFLARLDEP